MLFCIHRPIPLLAFRVRPRGFGFFEPTRTWSENVYFSLRDGLPSVGKRNDAGLADMFTGEAVARSTL
jgi:hypothetical protein